MSKVLLQFRNGESLQVGDQNYTRIAGEASEVYGEIIMDTFFGPMVFHKADFIARLVLPDDFDMASLDVDVLVIG